MFYIPTTLIRTFMLPINKQKKKENLIQKKFMGEEMQV